jgi:hypothetical protein
MNKRVYRADFYRSPDGMGWEMGPTSLVPFENGIGWEFPWDRRSLDGDGNGMKSLVSSRLFGCLVDEKKHLGIDFEIYALAKALRSPFCFLSQFLLSLPSSAEQVPRLKFSIRL